MVLTLIRGLFLGLVIFVHIPLFLLIVFPISNQLEILVNYFPHGPQLREHRTGGIPALPPWDLWQGYLLGCWHL